MLLNYLWAVAIVSPTGFALLLPSRSLVGGPLQCRRRSILVLLFCRSGGSCLFFLWLLGGRCVRIFVVFLVGSLGRSIFIARRDLLLSSGWLWLDLLGYFVRSWC